MRGKLSSRFLLCPTFRLSHDRSYCHNRTPANAGSRCGSNSGARRKCLEIRETVHARRPYQHSLETVEFLRDRKSTRLNSSHPSISYAVFCLKKKKKKIKNA